MALITGATGGLGRGFVTALPRGTELLLSGPNEEKIARFTEKLVNAGRTVHQCAADLSTDHGVEKLLQRADKLEVDLLINNAGIGRLGPVFENSASDERNTVAINVMALVMLTRGLLPGMIERARLRRQRAGIIIVSSTAAGAPVPFLATYAATKAFGLSFAQALAEELREYPVDILALCPGATRTNFGVAAGFRGGELPGAADPVKVAHDGLRALGQSQVKVTGILGRCGIGHALLSKPRVTAAIGRTMRCVVADMSGREQNTVDRR